MLICATNGAPRAGILIADKAAFFHKPLSHIIPPGTLFTSARKKTSTNSKLGPRKTYCLFLKKNLINLTKEFWNYLADE